MRVRCVLQTCYRRECRQSSRQPEPVDGGWSAWSGYSACSRTCDGGIMYKQRVCNKPVYIQLEFTKMQTNKDLNDMLIVIIVPSVISYYQYLQALTSVEPDVYILLICPVYLFTVTSVDVCGIWCIYTSDMPCLFIHSPAHGGTYCVGDMKKYKSCNMQVCLFDMVYCIFHKWRFLLLVYKGQWQTNGR